MTRGARRTTWAAFPAFATVLCASSPSWASPRSDGAPGYAQRDLHNVELEAGNVRRIIANARAAERTPEQRIADGELLLQTKDYPRAIVLLSEAIERYRDDVRHPAAYPDALTLLGEAYFQAKQPLSARRSFRVIVDHLDESRMQPYAAKSFARLVDIALRRQSYADLDDLLTKMSQWPAGVAEPTVQYARAKGLLVKRDFAGARASAGVVPPGHPLYAQARYLLGVLAMREAQAAAPPAQVTPGDPPPPSPPSRYAAAIEAFRQVTTLPPDTPEHAQVIDLAWMAVGRLFYETDQWFEAADAYNHVDRQSPHFGESLYELAWVYVRLGDSDRASRALEVLSVADPDNGFMADGALLRADLMLRSGQFDKALTVYQAVRAEYDPMRARVDNFLSTTTDPAAYYEKLAQEQMDAPENGATGIDTGQLPPIAVRWARDEQDGASAFAVLDNVAQCRDLLRQAQSLVGRLHVLLTSANRVRAFPDLKAGDEKVVELLNRVAGARSTIASGLDDAEGPEVSGELAEVRRQRRELQQRLAHAPVSEADLAAREASAQRQWNTVSQRLSVAQLEIDQMQAVVNGLRRMLSERGTTRDANQGTEWQEQLAANERDLKAYREQIGAVRQTIEIGRMQVGYGDQRFVNDENDRAAFRAVLAQEVRLVMAGRAGGASAYAAQVQPLLARADKDEANLLTSRSEITTEVDRKMVEVSAIVQREAANIDGYAARLESLDQEGRLVVGQVAMRNFGLVRDKLKNIVLRADVGSVEESWEVREEQTTRVRNLQVERVREEQILREELREVLDDATDAAPPAGGAPTPSP